MMKNFILGAIVGGVAIAYHAGLIDIKPAQQ